MIDKLNEYEYASPIMMIDGLIKLFAYAYRSDRIVVIDGNYCQNEQMLNMLSNWGETFNGFHWHQ